MGFFNNIFNKQEIRQTETDTSSILELVNPTNSVNLNEKTVLEVAGVKNALDVICGTIASLPVYLYQEKNGEIKKIENDNRDFLLNSEPSTFVQANKFKKDLIKDMLLNGKAYAMLDKKGLNIQGLYNVKNSQMTVTDIINNNGIITDKRYNFVLNTRSIEKNSYNVMEINYGEGILKENKEVLSTLLYISAYDNYIFKNAVLPSGVLETDGRLTEQGAKNIKGQIEKMYSGIRNYQKPLILEQGLKWKTTNQRPQDLMLDKAKDHATKDIEKLFNLPYGFLNNISNASIEGQNLLFLQRTITPVIVALEEGINRALLLESEKKNGYYFRFDVSEIMKMTNDKLIQYASQGITSGIMKINEARKILDLEPVDDGDKLGGSAGEVAPEEVTPEEVIIEEVPEAPEDGED